MKLKKCRPCKIYTIKKICPECNQLTDEAHYKYIKIKSVKD